MGEKKVGKKGEKTWNNWWGNVEKSDGKMGGKCGTWVGKLGKNKWGKWGKNRWKKG